MTTTIQAPVQHRTDVHYHWYNKYTKETTHTSLPGSFIQTDSRTTGPNIPDWKARIAKGENATTYLHGTRYSTPKLQLGDLVYTPGPNWTSSYLTRYGHLENIPFLNTYTGLEGLIQDADNKAKVKMIERANEHLRQFEGGVALGELRETLHLLGNPLKAIRRSIDDYYGIVYKRAKGVSKRQLGLTLSETWLEYVFGIKPLIRDVEEGSIALGRLLNGEYGTAKRFTATGISEDVTKILPRSRNWGYGKYWYSGRVRATVLVVYRAQVASKAMSPLQAGPELFGFDWESFIPTVYELIPYSFLIDYFSNIGDMISGWSYQDFGQTWQNRTQIVQIDNKLDNMHLDAELIKSRVDAGILNGATLKPYEIVRRYRAVTRETYEGSFVPSFSFQIPGIGSLKWLNIAGLVGVKSLARRKGRSPRRRPWTQDGQFI